MNAQITKEQIEKLMDFIKNSKKDMVELERLLTSVPALAPENGGQGEFEKCKVLTQWLKENGFTNIQQLEAPDSRVESKVRPSILVTIPGSSDDFSIWFIAHTDVVPAGELSLWKSDPWTLLEKDGKIIGRGVEDNQQGLVSAAFAALAFIRLGIKPAHTLKLLFIADEENGSSFGMIYLLKNENLFKKQDVILIPDGGDSKGETIEIAEKNIIWLKVKVSGKQSHASRPDLGCNACIAADDLSLQLNDLENLFNRNDSLFEPDYSTFQPTKRLANVEGVNIIPGEETFFMDCRILPCYSLEEVFAEIEKRCRAIENKYGVKIEYSALQALQSPATPKNAPIVSRLASALKKVHGIDARTIGIGGGTVAAELRKCGFYAAVWSTLDSRAHTANEYCIVDNIISDAQTMLFMAIED